jgi:hypothetical protein
MKMLDGKSLSEMIRKKKKNALRPDMDDAGQEAVDPNAAWDEKQASEINDVLDDPDHEPASASMMGENESSQSLEARKKISARIAKYMESL